MDFEKVIVLLSALGDQEVDYVLVGAIGMTVHGIVRATQDVDLFVRPEENNIERLRRALRQLFPQDPSIAEITAADLAGEYPAIRYSSPDGNLQLHRSLQFCFFSHDPAQGHGKNKCDATYRELNPIAMLYSGTESLLNSLRFLTQ